MRKVLPTIVLLVFTLANTVGFVPSAVAADFSRSSSSASSTDFSRSSTNSGADFSRSGSSSSADFSRTTDSSSVDFSRNGSSSSADFNRSGSTSTDFSRSSTNSGADFSRSESSSSADFSRTTDNSGVDFARNGSSSSADFSRSGSSSTDFSRSGSSSSADFSRDSSSSSADFSRNTENSSADFSRNGSGSSSADFSRGGSSSSADFSRDNEQNNGADFDRSNQGAGTRPTVTLIGASNMTQNAVTLTYNGTDPDFGDILRYSVCIQNTTQNGSSSCTTTRNEFFQFTGLDANTQYTWYVTVSDSVGGGTTTNGPLSFTTLAQQPANMPPVLTMGNITTTDTSATLNWSVENDNGTTALEYDICFSDSESTAAFSCAVSVTNVNQYTINNLRAGTTYYVVVRVREGSYVVYPSNGTQSFTTTGTPPANNRLPRVALGSVSNITSNGASFSWTGSQQDSGETFSYRFCLSTALNTLVSNTGNCTDLGNTTTTSRTNLQSNTTYYWTILASDGTYTNIPAFNGPQSFTTANDGTGNRVPSIVLISPANQETRQTQQNMLNWQGADQDTEDTLTYSVYVREVGATATLSQNDVVQDQYRVQNGVQSTSYQHTVSNSNQATRVFWTVRVMDGTTHTDAPIRSFNYTPETQNDAPVVTLTSPTNGSNQPVQNSYTLQWNGQDATALTYTVYAQEVNADSTVQAYTNEEIAIPANARITGTSQMSYSLSVTPGRRLFWTVRASDGTFNSLANNGPFRFDVTGGNQQNGINVQLDAVDVNGNVQTNFAQNAQVTARLRLTNTTNSARTLNFPTAQQYVFRVVNTANNSVIRTSVPAGGFSQTPSSLTINAGQTQTFTFPWNQLDSNGTLVSNGQYRIEGEVTTNPVITATPVIVTIGNGGTPANTAPTFTSFLPTSGSNFTSANPVQLSWTATDVNNDMLAYNLYLVEQTLTQGAPSLSTVMSSGNRINIASNATSYTFTPTLQRQYFWAVTVSDNVNPVVIGGFPFNFTVNQNATVNAGPTVRLLTPGAQPSAPAINYTTGGNRTFEWVTNDQDNPSTSTLINRLYVYEVNLSDTNQYTSAQIIANGTLRATTSNQMATISTSDQRRYWWTVDVTDGIVPSAQPAFNGPFTFTVNSNVTTPQSLVWDLVTSNSNSSNAAQQYTFSQYETIYIRASVRNSSNTTQTITFPSSNWMNVVANRVGYNQVAFSQNVSQGSTTLTLAAGQTFTFPAVSWNGINAATGSRDNGNYDINSSLTALNYSVTLPTRQISLYTSTSGGGGGGGGGSGGGSGGGGTSVDITTPLLLPTTDSGARTWYGPIRFDGSNGEVKIDLNHVDYNSGFCAKWTKDTVVTSGGQRFTGSYTPIKRLTDSQIDSDARTRLPNGAIKLYEYFLQYGNLAESYSKPVTICGTLPEDVRLKATNQANIAILGYDPQAQQWVKLGDLSNIADGRNFSVTISKSMILAFYQTGGVTPGGNNGNTNGNTDPIGDDTFCREFGSPFTDTRGHWSDYYVCRLYRMGVVTGYMEGVLRGLFGPDRGITRAELTKILVEMYGYDVESVNARNVFRDVTGDEWFAKYVVVAKQAGIVTGYEDGYFRPFRNINRAEAMKVILLSSGLATQSTVDAARLQEIADSDNYAGFRDIPEDQWFSGYISIGRRLGIISGKTANVFRAGDEMTRAEMAKVAFFVLELTDDNN